uniref:Platelet-activating factor acetylhydrolase IB subunit beta n=1 Tax=Cacopsylla melanoneura TaxID=428564 RepID=A0A8D8XHV2_9HEMI
MANPCLTPTKPADMIGDDRWLNQHEYHLQLAKESEPEVVFIGDSLISFLSQTDIWHDLFEPLHCLNFGIGGDKVEHVLWRVQDGVLDNIKPKVVVIFVGTNNTDDSPEHVADGIVGLVKLVQSKQPKATIFVMELLPRGKHMNRLWEKNIATNKYLVEKLSSLGPKVKLQVHKSDDFVINGNQTSATDFFDYLHMSETGNRKVFGPVFEQVKKVLADLDK